MNYTLSKYYEIRTELFRLKRSDILSNQEKYKHLDTDEMYYEDLCTVSLDFGRQTGKTYFLTKIIDELDNFIIIFPNEKSANNLITHVKRVEDERIIKTGISKPTRINRSYFVSIANLNRLRGIPCKRPCVFISDSTTIHPDTISEIYDTITAFKPTMIVMI